MTNARTFIAVLQAGAAAGDRTEKLALYCQFVGDWETDIITHAPDGARHQGHGEIHFGWVLQGRAVQDVWMIPRLRDRRPGAPIGFALTLELHEDHGAIVPLARRGVDRRGRLLAPAGRGARGCDGRPAA
jgi:hypothetical protein